VSRTTLRVYAASPGRCALGVDVLRTANDTWGETTIDWNNQPGSTGSVLANLAWTSKTGYRDFDVTPAVPGAGPVSFLLRHAPGCNVTSAVGLNSREAGSNRPQLVIETIPTPSSPACSDGLDNDSDGLIDHPADPGCTDASDTDETDPLPGVVIATAGDIVCDPTSSSFDGSQPAVCQHRATADLLTGADAVLTLGDPSVPERVAGPLHDRVRPSWGQHASTTYPAVGNHEYNIPGALGYFDYWALKGRPTGGVGAGYYIADLGSWRLIALNSNCSAVPCTEVRRRTTSSSRPSRPRHRRASSPTGTIRCSTPACCTVPRCRQGRRRSGTTCTRPARTSC
jgi:hypothetical protein